MKLYAFAIFDSKAQAFHTPFFLPNEALAVRAFANGVNDKNSELHRNPGDYSLFRIGHFDAAEGTIHPREKGIEVVHNGLLLVRAPAPTPQLELVPEQGEIKPNSAAGGAL